MTQFLSLLKYYWFFLISHFEGYAPVIRITVLLVMAFLLYYIGVFIRILFTAHTIKKELKREQKIKRRYDDRIQRLLYNEKAVSKDEAAHILNPENHTFKKWEKIHLTNLVLETKREVGWNVENYKKLLEVFPIIAFWEQHLRANNVKKSREALRILDQIHENIPGSIYATKLHTRNDDLRKHARSGYIKFASNDAFKTLEDGFDKKFNEFDKIRIHDALCEKDKKGVLPPLLKWVYSTENEEYKCFLIKEIGYFGQTDAADKLFELYKKEPDTIVKAQIVETLGVLKYETAIPLFIVDYEFSSTRMRAAIICAMGDMGTPEALRFLENKYPMTETIALRIFAIRNISKINRDLANKLAMQWKEVQPELFTRGLKIPNLI